MKRYRRLLVYVLRQWRALGVIVCLTCAFSLTAVLQPWPLKLLVDSALGDEPLPAWLGSILGDLSLGSDPVTIVLVAAGLSLGFFLLNSLLDFALNWAWTVGGQRMVLDLAADLFHRLQRLSLRYHRLRPVGDSLSRLTSDTWCLCTLSSSLLVTPIQQVATITTIGLVAWTLSPRLALLAMTVAPLLGVSAFWFGRRMKQRARRSREAQANLLSFVHQTLTAIPVVQAFGAERRNRDRFDALAREAVSQSQRGVFLEQGYTGTNGLATIVGSALVLVIGGREVLSGMLSIGTLLVFLAYLRTVQDATQALLNTHVNLSNASASVERILEVLDAEEEVREKAGAAALARARGEVRLEGVSFGYDAERPVLQEVTLHARPGETLALVGASGAGKSTLVSLIPRFFDPWQGRVLIDGVDVRDVGLKSLREQVALVLQEPFLLPLSVAENVAYGRVGASREQIERAARAANAHEFIERLPQGYETVLGERGATLSGGQRQRLSIARALVRDAPILILDEPTSALDLETEALLLEALERLMEGRTTFLIAHRLSTIRNADRIVVLQHGRVVEQGTHHELLAAGGTLQRLHLHQFAPGALVLEGTVAEVRG